MSRRSNDKSTLFIGRLNKHTRTRDLEDVFESYGRMSRCDIKYGAEMAYAFIDYEDRRDADDAMRYENGRDICGSAIIVEWAKGTPQSGGGPPSRGGGDSRDECYKCHRPGHWARDCPSDRGGGRSGGGWGGGGGGGGGGWRSRSPRRYRSRSRSRERGRRPRSRSRDRKLSGSRSPSPSGRKNGRSRSRSPSQ